MKETEAYCRLADSCGAAALTLITYVSYIALCSQGQTDNYFFNCRLIVSVLIMKTTAVDI